METGKKKPRTIQRKFGVVVTQGKRQAKENIFRVSQGTNIKPIIKNALQGSKKQKCLILFKTKGVSLQI